MIAFAELRTYGPEAPIHATRHVRPEAAILMVLALAWPSLVDASIMRPIFTVQGESELDGFGASVDFIGDFNGDGFDDIAVSAPGFVVAGKEVGRVYVFLGGMDPSGSPDLVIDGLAGEFFGRQTFGGGEVVSGGGDVNGDRYSDLVVAAPGADRVYVFFGGVSPDPEPDVVLSDDSFGCFGMTVNLTGDVNGDGFDDVIAAAGCQKILVFYGAQLMDGHADLQLTGGSYGTFGTEISSAHVNSDGYLDVLGVELSIADPRGPSAAHVHFGGSQPSSFPAYTLLGGTRIFDYVCTAGDVDGDRLDEVLVGARGYGPLEGPTIYIFSPGRGSPDLSIRGSKPRSVGDVNGDGFGDILAFYGDPRIYFGGARMDSTPDIIIDVAASQAAETAGDFDGDGIDDILISRSYPGSGRIWVFSSSDLSTPVLVSLASAQASQEGVHIRWHVGSHDVWAVRIERRLEGMEWLEMATTHVDPSGLVDFHDREVELGSKYGYRLAIDGTDAQSYSETVWLDVPLPFDLEIKDAYLLGQRIEIAFELGIAGTPRFAVLDVSGRQIAVHNGERFGAGEQVASFPVPRLAAGVYFVTLQHSHTVVHRRMIVLR